MHARRPVRGCGVNGDWHANRTRTARLPALVIDLRVSAAVLEPADRDTAQDP